MDAGLRPGEQDESEFASTENPQMIPPKTETL
jgi:hypothetical protein